MVYEPHLLTQSTFWMYLLRRLKTKMLTLQSSLRKSCPSSGTVCGHTLTSCGPSISVSFLTALTVVPGEGDDTSAACCTCRLPAYSMYCTGRPGGHPPDPTSSLLYTFAFICFKFLMAFETFLFRRSVNDTL